MTGAHQLPRVSERSGVWLRDVVEDQLERLTVAAGFSPPQRRKLHQLASLLSEGALDRPALPPFSGLSFINANGLPFQWSVSVGGSSRSVRFLCEGGPVGASARQRFAALWERLPEACAITGVRSLPSVERLMHAHLVPSAEEWPAHWRSAMWTGAGATADRIGLKVYFNLTAGVPVERWRRVARVLLALERHRSLERLCDYSGRVSHESWPVGLAIDADEGSLPGAVKVYFRSGAVDTGWLARWYETCGGKGDGEAVRLLLETFAPPARSTYTPGAFVVSLEFPSSDGHPVLKTEVELTRWIDEEREAVAGVRRLLHGLGLAEDDYLASLDALGTAAVRRTVHRLVGVRSDPSGELRVNVYLEPPLPAAQPARAKPGPCRGRRTAEGVQAAADWLRESRESGAWTDFRLPVGIADRWTTAYVTCILSLVESERETLEDLVEQGRDWLEAQRTPGAAWGYNQTTADDADSTALALVALRYGHRRLPPEASTVLRACLCADGGVATYPSHVPPGGAWVESVADVTPVAVEALSPAQDSPERRNALGWLLNRQRPDGLWNAYWWATPLYPAWWTACVFANTLPEPAKNRLAEGLLGWRAAGAFEQALRALALVELGAKDAAKCAARSLMAEQNSDGSWSSSAVLRLSRPVIRYPWREIDSGACYVDARRVFTTVTALAALAKAR